MISPARPPALIVEDWYQRHHRPLNFVLHLAGIPLTILGLLLVPVWAALASVSLFLIALALFVGGYLLQLLGHMLEGSEAGEVTYLRGRWRQSRLRAHGRELLGRWATHRAARAGARQQP